MTDALRIIDSLGLRPHPEGGYYRETYRADETLQSYSLPQRYGGPRSFCTAIYYLLTSGDCSSMHRLRSDELFHFYLGDPVEMLLLFPDGTGKSVTLGPGVLEGMHLQVTVPRGVWQGCRLAGKGQFALMAATVSPGFEFDDFELGNRDELTGLYPHFEEKIRALTR
jgi:predicted cupin superfamily sugar epimerase